MRDAPLIAGIELGGTKCVAMLASGPDDIHDRVQIATTRPDETLGAIAATLDRWQGFAALGIASFGPIAIDHAAGNYGSITATPKPGWQDTDVAKRLARRYDVPTGFHTDVVGAALAESRWGAARGLDDLAYVTVGTGVGVGLVAGGRPVDGMTHAELGHLKPVRLPGDDWPGACPFHGACVEGLAAGSAIAARTGMKGQDLGADHPVWEGVVQALAQLLATLALTGVPRRIVMGGGVMVGNPFLFPRIQAAVKASINGYLPVGAFEAVESYIVPAALGADAGPLGAVVLGAQALSEASETDFSTT